MLTATTHGAVNWLDLSTPDPGGASLFYRDLLGWDDVAVADTPLGAYFTGMVGDREVAGMMEPEEDDAPAAWTLYVYVDDLDGALSAVPEAGGAVLAGPIPLPNGWRVAIVTDPTGAMLGLSSSDERIDVPYLGDDPGQVCWVELLTRDPAAAESFYATVLGWKATTTGDPEAAYTVFEVGDELAAGMMRLPDEVPAEVPSFWSAYFAVADCAIAEWRAVELGGGVVRPGEGIDAGTFAVLADPQGAMFNVMAYRD